MADSGTVRVGPRLRLWLVLVAGVSVGLAGCSVASSPAVVQTPSPTANPCPTTVPSPFADASLPADLDAETRDAIEFRTKNGLRRDVAWIRDVAADPTADTAFGVPLLPAEASSLFARNELSVPVQAVLDRYGHTDEFGGLYTDHAQGGVVVLLWTTDPAIHEAAIRPELPACHPVHFRQVRWSERVLRGWQDKIGTDLDWLAEIPAAFQGVGVDIIENVVDLQVSSAAPDAADRIVAHYDAPAGMIRVESDGTGAALLPSGTVVGRVLLANGRPPGPNDLMLDAGSPGDPPGWCGGGDIGYGVGEDGTIEFPCKAGRRTILVKDWTSDYKHPVIASVVVEVPADGHIEVEIRLPEGFDPSATP